MARLGDVTAPSNGAEAPDAKLAARYCARCGQPASAGSAAIERFGEAFCSEAHAEEFVQAVRAARVETAAAAASTPDVERPAQPAGATSKPQGWKGLLKMGLCCGAPILALVVLAGGGGAVLGAAGALLPALALLACPLGMYFMMRSMSKTGQQDDRSDRGGQK